MARTNQEVTPQEGKAWKEWATKNNVDFNDDDNLLFINDYFQQWNEDITEQNLDIAYRTGAGFKERLKTYAPGQLEFAKLYAALSPDEKKEFGDWKYPGVKGDSYTNGIALITWLKAHGFQVTKHNLSLAVGQKNVTPHLELEAAHQSTLNRHKRHEDDGKKFLTEGLVSDGHGGLRSMTYAEQKAAREAAEAAKNKPVQTSSTPDAWSQMVSQLLQFGTARQQKEIKVVHDYCVAQNYSPRRTWDTVNKLVERLKQDAVNSSRSIH